jgi:hypothetical protein
MQIFIVILTTLLARAVSQTKFCTNCKYFMKDGFFASNTFGRCQKYSKTNDMTSEYLVTGQYRKPISNYYYCSTVRSSNDMCGPSGKDFEKK